MVESKYQQPVCIRVKKENILKMYNIFLKKITQNWLLLTQLYLWGFSVVFNINRYEFIMNY